MSHWKAIEAYNGTNYWPVRMDGATRALNFIDYAHHEIHAGSGFVCTDIRSVDTTTMQWMVTTPAGTKWAHMLFAFQCTGEMQVVITEGADRTGTNALVEINRERNAGGAATTVVHNAVSSGTTDGATTIYSIRTGATNVAGKTISTSGVRGTNEFILKAATKYIVTVTTYAAVQVTAEFDWYEHTDQTT